MSDIFSSYLYNVTITSIVFGLQMLQSMSLSVICLFFILTKSTIWNRMYEQIFKRLIAWNYLNCGCRFLATVLQFQCNLYPLHIEASAVKGKTRRRFHLLWVNLLLRIFFSFFLNEISIQNTKQTLICLQVCVLRGRLHQFEHLFTSKKTTVFSGCSLYCAGVQRINLCSQEKGEGRSWAHSSVYSCVASYRLLFFLVCVCYLVFKSAWQRATLLCCDTVGLWPTSKAMALRWPCP